MIVYEIRNKINGKSYIGQHSFNDLGSYWGSGKLIKKAIEKYGLDNFERIVLERCSDENELNEREKYWISKKDAVKNGYNLIDGGTGGDTSKFIDYSDEWKEKVRVNIKQYWESLSEIERQMRSETVKGEKNGMFGKIGYWKGKKLPADIIQKQLESRRSYEGEENPNWKGGVSKKECECGNIIALNNETCFECRDRNGEKNPFFGKTHSKETKIKLSEARKGKKPINIKPVMIDSVVYESLTEASRQTGIPQSSILWRIKSKNKKYENYVYHPAIKAPLSN